MGHPRVAGAVDNGWPVSATDNGRVNDHSVKHEFITFRAERIQTLPVKSANWYRTRQSDSRFPIFGARPRQALICRSASHSPMTTWKREAVGPRTRNRPAVARSAEESARAVDAGGVRQQIHMGAEHMTLRLRGDHGMDDQFEDLWMVLHEHGQAFEDIAQRFDVHRRQSPIAEQTRGGLDRTDHVPSLRSEEHT